MKWEVVIPEHRLNDCRVAIYEDGAFCFEVLARTPILAKALADEIVALKNRCPRCHGTGKVVPGYVTLSDPCPCTK
jgi:hypothetical protein